MPIIFRPVRSCLYKSMEERRIYSNASDFFADMKEIAKEYQFDDADIELKYDCHDNRIEWSHCSYVVANEGYKHLTIGYCSTDFDDSFWDEVKNSYKNYAEEQC